MDFPDLHSARIDAENADEIFRGLNIQNSNINKHKNVDQEQFQAILERMHQVATQNGNEGKKTCFVFSYAGHGGILPGSGATVAVLNAKPGTLNWTFPIEEKLKQLSMIPGCFVIGLLSCCREQLQQDNGDHRPSARSAGNHVIIFDCPAYQRALDDGQMTTDFKEHLRFISSQNNRSLFVFPRHLKMWRPRGKMHHSVSRGSEITLRYALD